MKTLTVSLNYSSTEYSPNITQHQTPLALPLLVLDSDGTLIAEGVASTTMPAQFDISHVDGPTFVRLTWPSGKTQTQRVVVEEGATGQASFNDSSISRNEWSAWAVPQLNERTSLASSEVASDLRIDKYDRVWLRMWTFENSVWVPTQVESKASYQSDSVRQLDFELTERCWLLQLGGTYVPWRFVALPSGGACRVLFTPNESNDPRAEPLKVIVTSFRRDAEMLLEFLARDWLRLANSLANALPLAQHLLAGKMVDPVSAIAGAYFLLRTEGWRQTPLDWFNNLYQMFPWLADPAVILCVLMIRQGLSSDGDTSKATSLLQTCLNRGMPVYSEGLSLLQEAASTLRSASGSAREGVFEQVEHLVASQAWAGAVLSFYGTTPHFPSPARVVGQPGKSRPLTRTKSSTTRSSPSERGETTAMAFTYLRDL